MNSKIAITDIIELVFELRRKISKYENNLQRNEMLVRYTLIDPFLRVLGWDTEDPDQVEPEFSTEAGVPDYALKLNGEVVAFIEAKALQKHWDILKLITYANAKGVPYVIATDGDRWRVYDVFKRVEADRKLVVSWQITKDNPAEIAFRALSIANFNKVFGTLPGTPLFFERGAGGKEVMSKESVGEGREGVFEGPLNTRLARFLVLRILAEKGKPMRMKNIVKEIGKRIKFTRYDIEQMRSGKMRWEAMIRWAIFHLVREGLIERVEKGIYMISEKGHKKLLGLGILNAHYHYYEKSEHCVRERDSI